jgi:hypothetical protein
MHDETERVFRLQIARNGCCNGRAQGRRRRFDNAKTSLYTE